MLTWGETWHSSTHTPLVTEVSNQLCDFVIAIDRRAVYTHTYTDTDIHTHTHRHTIWPVGHDQLQDMRDCYSTEVTLSASGYSSLQSLLWWEDSHIRTLGNVWQYLLSFPGADWSMSPAFDNKMQLNLTDFKCIITAQSLYWNQSCIHHLKNPKSKQTKAEPRRMITLIDQGGSCWILSIFAKLPGLIV